MTSTPTMFNNFMAFLKILFEPIFIRFAEQCRYRKSTYVVLLPMECLRVTVTEPLKQKQTQSLFREFQLLYYKLYYLLTEK